MIESDVELAGDGDVAAVFGAPTDGEEGEGTGGDLLIHFDVGDDGDTLRVGVEDVGGRGLGEVDFAGDVDGAFVGGDVGGGDGEEGGFHDDADVGFTEVEAFDEDAVETEGGGFEGEVFEGGEAGGVGEGAGDVEGDGAFSGEDGAGGKVSGEELLDAGPVAIEGGGDFAGISTPREDGAGRKGDGIAEVGDGIFFGDGGVGGNFKNLFGGIETTAEIDGGSGVGSGGEEVGKILFERGDVEGGGDGGGGSVGGGGGAGLDISGDVERGGLSDDGAFVEIGGLAGEVGVDVGGDEVAVEGVALEDGAGRGEVGEFSGEGGVLFSAGVGEFDGAVGDAGEGEFKTGGLEEGIEGGEVEGGEGGVGGSGEGAEVFGGAVGEEVAVEFCGERGGLAVAGLGGCGEGEVGVAGGGVEGSFGGGVGEVQVGGVGGGPGEGVDLDVEGGVEGGEARRGETVRGGCFGSGGLCLWPRIAIRGSRQSGGVVGFRCSSEGAGEVGGAVGVGDEGDGFGVEVEIEMEVIHVDRVQE